MSSILRYLSPLNFRIITSEQEERQEKQPTSLDEKTVQAFIASKREQTEVQRKELAVRERNRTKRKARNVNTTSGRYAPGRVC